MTRGWTRRLFWRIALAFLALISVVLVAQAAAFVWLYQSSQRVSSADLHQQALTWTRAISADLGQALEASSGVDIGERLATIDVTHRIFVIFRDGRVIGSPPENAVATVTADFHMVPDGGPMPISWERSVYAAAPLRVGGTVVGVIGLTPRSAIERFGPLVGAVGMLMLVAAVLLFSFAVVAPLKSRLMQLRTAAKQLEEGVLQTRVAVDGTDEVAEVAQAFNSMASELERHTTALETSDRLRRQLVADVSHELMTPLTAVLGHLETLTMDEVRLDESERRRQLAIAQREALRLRRVIGDLLESARFEADGGELNVEEISTHHLFQHIMSRHERDCRVREVRLSATVLPGAELFEADPFRIEQAIDNAIVNALRHTASGGYIAIAAGRSGDNVVIEVRDTGEGIPARHLPHIFERFYKASSASGIASPGTGLGLSIVKAIIERHGGRVSATSKPGDGTTITMELPAASLVESAAVADEAAWAR
jgi:signal transduction histidine kinase